MDYRKHHMQDRHHVVPPSQMLRRAHRLLAHSDEQNAVLVADRNLRALVKMRRPRKGHWLSDRVTILCEGLGLEDPDETRGEEIGALKLACQEAGMAPWAINHVFPECPMDVDEPIEEPDARRIGPIERLRLAKLRFWMAVDNSFGPTTS